MTRRLWTGLAVLLSVAGVATGIAAAPASASPSPKNALLYGDSLVWEARAVIASTFVGQSGWVQHTHSFPGFALCDFLDWLPADLALYHPSVVAVETAGNYTRPCEVDANGNPLVPNTDAYYAKFRADLHAFLGAVTETGATAVVVSAPPMLDAAWNGRTLMLQAIAKQVAASYPGVSIATAPRTALAAGGAYTATKPCLKTETAAMGCVARTIPIRTITGTQTGIHLCPPGLDTVYPYVCPVYSSGEVRYGGAITSSVVAPPAAIRPTVLMKMKPAVEGQPLQFTPRLKYAYARNLTLCYATHDGTAIAASGDYTPIAAGCVVIPAWSTTGPTIQVQTLIDHLPEPTSESVALSVSGQTVPITGDVRTFTTTIKANTT